MACMLQLILTAIDDLCLTISSFSIHQKHSLKWQASFLLYLRGYVTENCSTIRTGITIHDQPERFVFAFSATSLLITLHR